MSSPPPDLPSPQVQQENPQSETQVSADITPIVDSSSPLPMSDNPENIPSSTRPQELSETNDNLVLNAKPNQCNPIEYTLNEKEDEKCTEQNDPTNDISVEQDPGPVTNNHHQEPIQDDSGIPLIHSEGRSGGSSPPLDDIPDNSKEHVIHPPDDTSDSVDRNGTDSASKHSREEECQLLTIKSENHQNETETLVVTHQSIDIISSSNLGPSPEIPQEPDQSLVNTVANKVELSDSAPQLAQNPHYSIPAETESVRNAVIDRIKTAIVERESLLVMNNAFQHKLAEMFRKRRAEDKNTDMEKSVVDQDQRLSNLMISLRQLHDEYNTMGQEQGRINDENKIKLMDKKQEHMKSTEEFRKYRMQIAKQSENSRTGQLIPIKQVLQIDAQDQRKEAQVANVRLNNIKLKNKLKRHELTLHKKEELADGLHLIDFEQLKIENMAYSEKIEERNEELMKLGKKITNIVQVLAHFKEKLQFVYNENQHLTETLVQVDQIVNTYRDQLPNAKHARDKLRMANIQLKQANGLLHNRTLLLDYQQQYDKLSTLRSELDGLQKTYQSLHAAMNKH